VLDLGAVQALHGAPWLLNVVPICVKQGCAQQLARYNAFPARSASLDTAPGWDMPCVRG
jgi:hypothetical protein